jgi:hypothetical protein
VKYPVIMERRLTDWYMHLPAVDRCLPVSSPADAPRRAARFLSAETGAAVDPQHVEVLQPVAGDVLLPATPAEVAILHDDGAWYPGRRVGWLRQRDRSWRALVCYVVAGVQWERTLPASRLNRAARPVSTGLACPSGTR